MDEMSPGTPLPPANSKAYWNWKGDDAAFGHQGLNQEYNKW